MRQIYPLASNAPGQILRQYRLVLPDLADHLHSRGGGGLPVTLFGPASIARAAGLDD
jgi:hypothetical protein